jgi:hypothetical protein
MPKNPKPVKPKQEEKPLIRLNVSENTPFYYVNFLNVTHSAYDFTISVTKFPSEFSDEQKASLKNKEGITLDASLQIVITPALVRGLIKALTMQAEKFEARFGELPSDIPKENRG